MFAARYFASTYYPPRYFPKIGGIVVAPTGTPIAIVAMVRPIAAIGAVAHPSAVIDSVTQPVASIAQSLPVAVVALSDRPLADIEVLP